MIYNEVMIECNQLETEQDKILKPITETRECTICHTDFECNESSKRKACSVDHEEKYIERPSIVQSKLKPLIIGINYFIVGASSKVPRKSTFWWGLQKRKCLVCGLEFECKKRTTKKTCKFTFCINEFRSLRMKQWRQFPENKAIVKISSQKHYQKNKDRKKSNRQKPEVKANYNAYQKDYQKSSRQKPKSIAYQKDYQKLYRQKPKVKANRQKLKIEKNAVPVVVMVPVVGIIA